jgi:hypothetical protein
MIIGGVISALNSPDLCYIKFVGNFSVEKEKGKGKGKEPQPAQQKPTPREKIFATLPSPTALRADDNGRNPPRSPLHPKNGEAVYATSKNPCRVFFTSQFPNRVMKGKNVGEGAGVFFGGGGGKSADFPKGKRRERRTGESWRVGVVVVVRSSHSETENIKRKEINRASWGERYVSPCILSNFVLYMFCLSLLSLPSPSSFPRLGVGLGGKTLHPEPSKDNMREFPNKKKIKTLRA